MEKENRKRYANRHKVKYFDSDLIYLKKGFSDDLFNFEGEICYYNFKNADLKIVLPNGKVIIDKNYKLLEFYNYSLKTKLSAFYNDKDEIIEWYFDISKEIGKEGDVPYEDDLYLDVVVRPNGEVELLDEDEIKDALNENKVTKEEYDMAYFEANKLLKLLENNKKNLKEFTDKYLKYFENNENI